MLFAIAEGYYRIRGEEGLGMGDVKLLAMIGAFLGWKLVLLTLVMASLLWVDHRRRADRIQARRHEIRAAVRDLSRDRRRRVGRLGHTDRGLVLRLLSMSLQAYALLAITAMIALLIARHRVRRVPLPVGRAEEPLSQPRRWRLGADGGCAAGRDPEVARAGTRDDRTR